MGYFAHIRDHDISITNLKHATRLLNEAGFPGNDFVDCLNKWAYDDVELDSTGNVTTLAFNNKYRDDDRLWATLAPVIDSAEGKYLPFIEWEGEDNEMWRFVFRNGKMIEVGCDIVWPYLNEAVTAPAVVEPVAVTTLHGRNFLTKALYQELTITSDTERANEIRMTIKSIEDAEKVVLNLEVIQ